VRGGSFSVERRGEAGKEAVTHVSGRMLRGNGKNERNV